MKRIVLVVLLALTLAGCGASPLGLLTGGGPNVAANTQVGKNNSQAIISDQSTKTITAPAAERVQVTNVDWWMVGLLCFFAGVLFPSHREIAGWIRQWFARNKKPTP